MFRNALKKSDLDREIVPISSDTPTIETVSEHLDSEYWYTNVIGKLRTKLKEVKKHIIFQYLPLLSLINNRICDKNWHTKEGRFRCQISPFFPTKKTQFAMIFCREFFFAREY